MAECKSVRSKIMELSSNRILVLDGAMGVMIQGKSLGEDDFRGERFRDHPLPLKGCGEVLCLERPDIILGIHEAYLEAGADIIETNSFNATRISLSDFGLGDLAYELSFAAARLAREAADKFSRPDNPRFVAGSMGPTSKSAGISPDLNNPGSRAVTWDELEAAYYDNARGLLDGGADLFLIETIFDSLNAKAAIFAVQRLAGERDLDLPILISATVMEKGGRLLSGQTLEAFCASVLHADPLALGLNCSFGAEKMKPYIAAISGAASCLVCAYPNAGLPNREGSYDEDPEAMADHIEDYLREGIVNIAGGCCGSTPAHIAAIAARAANYVPRALPLVPEKIILAGLEASEFKGEDFEVPSMTADDRELIGLINKGEYDEAAELAREMAEDGTGLFNIYTDELSAEGLTNFLNHALPFPDLVRLPLILSGSSRELIEAGLKCLPGKSLVNFYGADAGMEKLVRSYGAALIGSLIESSDAALGTA